MLISARTDPQRAWQARMPDEEVQLSAGTGCPIQIRVDKDAGGGFVLHQPMQTLRIRVVDAHTIVLESGDGHKVASHWE